MASTSVPKNRAKSAAARSRIPPNGALLDTVDQALSQAHATLDLIYTAAADPEHGSAFIEGLCVGTLANALHHAMCSITEAQEAAGLIQGEVSHG